MAQIVVGMPPQIMDLMQQGALERAFHDPLFSQLSFRQEAVADVWGENAGQEIVQTRAGLLMPAVEPLEPGADPLPVTAPYEQWVATLKPYGSSVDTHMPTATTVNANLFMQNITSLGIQAGRSLNLVARNALFKSYLSGHTVSRGPIASNADRIAVASLNGFVDTVQPNVQARPFLVSAAQPLPITIGNAGLKAYVIQTVPDIPGDPDGPGTLILSAPVGVAFVAPRTPIVSAYAPKVIRSAGGLSVDAITQGDTLSLQAIVNAVAQLRDAGVSPHDDGFFHAHISSLAQAQLYNDPVFQQLNRGLPDGQAYAQGWIGHMLGVAFFMNTENPTLQNVGAVKPTGDGSGVGYLGQYGTQIGAEVVNGNGVKIGRVLLTGKGALYERYKDQSGYVTEAGVTGKIGEFDVTVNNVSVLTDHVRLIIRSPIDRLQQWVSSSWNIETSFVAPSDATAPSGPERYKRALILEFAL